MEPTNVSHPVENDIQFYQVQGTPLATEQYETWYDVEFKEEENIERAWVPIPPSNIQKRFTDGGIPKFKKANQRWTAKALLQRV